MSELDKEFTYEGVTVTRRDYESMPCPMCALEVDDETMREIAKSTFECLLNAGWDTAEIAIALVPGANASEGDELKELLQNDFWKYMEKSAVDHGMRYYEDIKENGE